RAASTRPLLRGPVVVLPVTAAALTTSTTRTTRTTTAAARDDLTGRVVVDNHRLVAVCGIDTVPALTAARVVTTTITRHALNRAVVVDGDDRTSRELTNVERPPAIRCANRHTRVDR